MTINKNQVYLDHLFIKLHSYGDEDVRYSCISNNIQEQQKNMLVSPRVLLLPNTNILICTYDPLQRSMNKVFKLPTLSLKEIREEIGSLLFSQRQLCFQPENQNTHQFNERLLGEKNKTKTKH